MKKAITIFFVALFLSATISAQTTEFTYQGRLLDNTLPATGNYDLQFRLWSSETGGGGFGVETRPNVAVSQGIFTVVLDFGNLFTGPERWIEISIRPAGSSEPYLTLSGRQRLTSTPYAIKSLNSDTATTATNSSQLGGVPASEYVITTDPRMTDERQPAPFSGNYIQNTPSQQAASNFFISGLGRANILSANTQFNLGTNRILASPGSFNFFAGIGTGASVTTGGSNTLVGGQAGDSLTQGGNNSFFGAQAGRSTVSANGNSFFGANAGRLNTDGGLNSFFGLGAGEQNVSATGNSFFGAFSGSLNTTGTGNSFFGRSSGGSNVGGSRNSFFGFESGNNNIGAEMNSFFGAGSGRSNTTGINNTFIGTDAGRSNTQGYYNTFAGANAGYSTVDGFFNSFFGNDAGYSNAGGRANTFVGALAGAANVNGESNAFFGLSAGQASTGNWNAYFGANAGLLDSSGASNSFFGGAAGSGNNGGSNNTAIGFLTRFGSPTLTNATAIGNSAQVSTSNSLVLGSINGVNGATADTNVGIGTTSPTDRLHVVGNSRLAGNVIVTGGLTASFSPGTAGAPGFSFVGDPSTGLFSTGAGNLGFSTSGSSRMSINPNGVVSIGIPGSGALGSPRLRVSGDDDLSPSVAAENINPAGIGAAFVGNRYGVFGIGTGIGIGESIAVFGSARHESGDGFRIGVLGELANAGSGGGAGVYGRAPVGPNNWAGFFQGRAQVTGPLTVPTIVPPGTNLSLGEADDIATIPGSLRIGNSSVPRGQINLFSSSGNANFYLQGAGSTVGINMATGTGPGNPTFFISHYDGVTYNDRLVISPSGAVRINVLGSAGGTSLCRNASNEISTCSSSMKYKQDVTDYRPAFNLFESLRPVAFNWIEGGTADVGLVAEEVAAIEPLLVTYNDKGEVEGVKYDRIGVVLVNVVKEQQAQIELLEKQAADQNKIIEELRKDIEALKAIVTGDRKEVEREKN